MGEHNMYRIGYPFWKTFARMGVPLKLRVLVQRDDEAGVFIATSDDLRGLAAEAETMDALVVEVKSVIDDLLVEALHAAPPNPPVADLRLCAA
jgi:predicted RNase H-like HicB family nuclease